jgi:hypothetical protein
VDKLRLQCREGAGEWYPAEHPSWRNDFEYREAPSQHAPEFIGFDLVQPGSEQSVFTVYTPAPDPGAHYRYAYRVNLSETDKANGYVDVKLDPARICDVYGITNMMQSQAVKKVLCAGNRGHKDFSQDIKDIKCALDRWEEMLKEDGSI